MAAPAAEAADEKEKIVQETDDKNISPRHPRWTKLETLVLIEGKKIAENQGTRSKSSLLVGTRQPEPKWDVVSSYCKQHGVNRGPVQCRKRWSNMICDFKKIKGWEARVKEERGESFWMMRSDVRRDKKLPGFFDKEVFCVLDGKAAEAVSADKMDLPTETETEDEEVEEVHDASSHGKRKVKLISAPPWFEEPEEILMETIHSAEPISAKGKQAGVLCRRSIFQDGVKRQRLSFDGCQGTNLNDQLIKVMEKNTQALNAQLDTQNMNSRLEREQHKDQSDKLVSTLSKISDALAKIADKL